MSADGLADGVEWIGDPPWVAWTPGEIVAAIGPIEASWCVTAGWAVDLFVGRQTRPHGDLEIAVPRSEWPILRESLGMLEFMVAGDERLWPLDGSALEEHDQTWGRDDTGVFRVDVFRDRHDGDTWICKRDDRIRRSYSSLIETTPTGIPFMAPEAVLLFKAKHDQEKDRHDLAACLPLMDKHRIEWLADALRIVHPGHPWLTDLAASVIPRG